MSTTEATLRVQRRPALDLVMVTGVILIAAGAALLATGVTEPPLAVAALLGSGVLILMRRSSNITVAGLALPYLALPGLLGIIQTTAGAVPIPVWLALAACWFAAIAGVSRLSALRGLTPTAARVRDLVVAALFGLWLVILWEALIVGFKVPFILLPPPSAVWLKLTTSIPTLAADFRQTFLKAVLAGYAIGCGSGFLVAIVADRVGFLKRGLLPVGNLVSALPIIGVAPIMVMWFGFDWPSKAAVVVIMTFFPMLVNTLAGLSAADAMERDLMRTYAANYWQSLMKLRLPAALPFIFNALKINSTLAMIGAIVAEFFGTPVVGMGFRISTEVGRMNIDMVWAEIAVAALAGSVFYGVVALIERAATFWHPSFRHS
jgi:NitT/TauT family transport system permease protein